MGKISNLAAHKPANSGFSAILFLKNFDVQIKYMNLKKYLNNKKYYEF